MDFSEIEVVADDRSAVERLGDTNPDSIDLDTLRCAFPKIFEVFANVPEWTLLAALEAANMNESKAIRNLKAKMKQAKALGHDLKSAEKNEQRQFIERRETVVKQQVHTMEVKGEREELTRLQRLTAGERSIELAKTEAAYIGVQREALQQTTMLGEQPTSMAEKQAVRLTAEDGEADDDAAERGDADLEMADADTETHGSDVAMGEAEGEAQAEGEGEGGEMDVEMGRLPLRKLQDFVLHDAAGQLCRLEVLDCTRSSCVYASGFVCGNTDGVDEQEAECAGASSGYYVAKLGPFRGYGVSGFSRYDSSIFPHAGIFLATETVEYELGEPAEQYAPLLAPLLEKVELCKRVVRGLEASPQMALSSLLEAVGAPDDKGAQRGLEFDEAFVMGHGKFVLSQLRSYDKGAGAGELRTLGCAAMVELAGRLDFELPKAAARRGKGSSGPRGGVRREPVRACAGKTEWVGKGESAAAAKGGDTHTRHEAAKVDGHVIRVGSAASLQPYGAEADAPEKQADLVRVEALYAEGGAKGRMMCTVRRLWRPADTFVAEHLDSARFPPALLLPDTETRQMAVAHLCKTVTVLEAPPVEAGAGAGAGARGSPPLHVGRWRFSQRFATYSLAPEAAAAEAAPAAAPAAAGKRKAAPSGAGAEAARTTLNVLELYAGSGGLSFTEAAGPVGGRQLRARWCCEYNKEEAETYRKNHPECAVFHLDCEDFLRECQRWAAMASGAPAPPKAAKKDQDKQAAAKRGKGRKRGETVLEVLEVRGEDREIQYKCRVEGAADPKWVTVTEEGDEVPDEKLRAFVLAHRASLPLPENVDMVTGGPPCQGVSGFNLFRHSTDPMTDTKNRQTLVFADMCELQQPRFVIMENVVGILMFAESLVLRRCMNRFLCAGYQVSVGVCVSGSFGLPQNRARTILFGARADVALPAYPRPTHRLREDVPISMMTTRMKEDLLNVPSKEAAGALAAPPTLRDAFSDLPSIKAPPAREFNTNKDNWVPKKTAGAPHRAVEYKGRTSGGEPVAPRCGFQRAARAGCGGALHDHESFVLNGDDLERVQAVPKTSAELLASGDKNGQRRRACWVDIPEYEAGKPDTKTKTKTGKPLVPEYAKSYRRPFACFGRLAWSDIVPTVVCRPEPHNRPIIHPDEDRILSIRENARIQGFPDSYEFCGSIYTRYRQVGNAVSPKLAQALGLQILRAFAGASPHGDDEAAAAGV